MSVDSGQSVTVNPVAYYMQFTNKTTQENSTDPQIWTDKEKICVSETVNRAANWLTLKRQRLRHTGLSSYLLMLFLLCSPQQVLDGSPIEVTLAKPVDKDSYVRYTRGTGGRGAMLQGDYTYSLGHVYDPTTTYLGAPVFYAPQAYTAIPSLHFPGTKGHLGNRAIIRAPSVRGNAHQLLPTNNSTMSNDLYCNSLRQIGWVHWEKRTGKLFMKNQMLVHQQL